MKRILVVEDEPAIAIGLRDSLEAEGHAVEVVSDGVEAETRAREGGFDLILLDVMLPGRDGFSICRILHGGRERSASCHNHPRLVRIAAATFARWPVPCLR
ncbi:hypothetical protein SBA4_4680005 [Candidatus Sulfopaludibacter sp. SbA4]|nr:hypothetical protein SBA4_4680005 [Candidatus Sulfopaludibacter sp. SbA4]